MLSNTEIDLILKVPARRCVVLVDIIESVRLFEANEAATVRQWLRIVEFAKGRLEGRKNDRIVKSTGDGLLAEFQSEKHALAFSLALQAHAGEANVDVPDGQRMFLKIGIENANVFEGFGDIFGHGVNVAARLSDLAGPGDIVISSSVRSQIDPGIDAEVEDLGKCYLKHITDPVRAFRVHPIGPGSDLQLGASTTELRPTIAIVILPDPTMPAANEILAEELGFVFSRSQHINLISRLSASAVARPDISLSEIANLLGANFVIFGRMMSDDRSLSVRLTLHAAQSSRDMWTEQFNFSKSGIIEQFQAHANDIAERISTTIIRHEVRKVISMPLPTVESYGLLLASIAGMYSLGRREFERSGQILEHLVYREKRHPLPHAWMAYHHVLGASQGWLPDGETAAQKALGASQRALDIDPQNEMALTFDGVVRGNLMGRLDEAESCYQAATDINPSAALATLQHGMLYAFRGEGEQSVKLCMRAQSLSPLDPHKFLYDSLTAAGFFVDGQFQKAVDLAKRSLKANASHASALRTLAMAQWELGDVENARETVTKLTVLDPKFSVSSWKENYPDKTSGQIDRLAKLLQLAGAPH